jgi:TonB-linked SusC/RagA family outer membrane protein
LPLFAFSQEMALMKMASASERNSESKPAEEKVLLKKVLTEWADHYKINFNYDSGLLKKAYVSKPSEWKSDAELDQSLEALLSPVGLKVIKVEKDIYVIQVADKLPSDNRLLPNVEAADLPQNQQPAFVQVSGKVVADDGQPLPGVSVLVKGTTTGTATDAGGAYTINAEPNSTLVFSFIGYTTEEVQVGNRTTIDVTMTPDIKSLSEVVVTALGIKKESKKLGYATANVAPEQITTNRTVNFMNSLQGKIAGVNITTLGSGPAGTSKIRIRGQSSFGGQNNPLIVVNGVPIDNTNFGVSQGSASGDGSIAARANSNNVSDGGDGLSSINPDDIESMTVLKGGTAAALYGSRAKDGVIMITTKTKGSNRGIGVDWNSNFVSDTPLDFTDYQYEYGQGEFGVRPTGPNPTSGQWSFGERFQPGMTQVLFNGITVPYEPVRNQVTSFYRRGSTWTNTVTLSAGGEKGGFSLSLSNMDNKSIVPNSSFNRKTINLGFSQNLSRKLIVTGNVNYSNEYYKNPPQIAVQDLSTPTVIYNMANSMPMYLLEQNRVDANGNEIVWTRFRNRTNPYISVYDRFENIRRDRIFGNITLRYNFTDWLYVQGRIGQDYYSRDQDFNYPTGAAVLSTPTTGPFNGSYTQDVRRFRETNSDFLVGANRKFGNFGIDLTLGGNQRYVRSDYNSVRVDEFIVRGLYTVMNGARKDPIYDLQERQVNSLYGAAEFSFKDFLYLNVTARNDWFSTLSKANRSILYPSVTGSFVFSQAFASLPSWLSFGKLRAAYAEVGSDLDIQPYSNNLFYGSNANLFPGPNGQPQAVGFISGNSIPNSQLKPMRVSEMEFGVELKFFDNRLGLDLTYYDKITKDQILRAQTSDASGYISRLINVGKSKNSGLEMLVTGTPIRSSQFNWEVGVNASYNTSKVLNLGLNPGDTIMTVGTGEFIGELRQWVGHPLGQLFGYGLRRDAQGRQVFNASNGTPLRTNIQVPFGTAIPVWVGGITNTFNYKGISLSFLIDFKLGHKLISGTNHNAWRHGLHKGTLVGREQGYVTGVGVYENGETNESRTPVQTYYETVRGLRISEGFVYDAGFWKLRQITLGYDFTRFLPKNSYIRGLRLSAVANNVLIIKKWVDNIDPEQFGLASDNVIGLESTGLPTSRSIGFNLNVKF